MWRNANKYAMNQKEKFSEVNGADIVGEG